MRLLRSNTGGEFSLTDDFHEKIPPYAILSHTWGAEAEEVTFGDIKGGTAKGKPGYAKIRFCGEQARQDGIQYFWVDTCCIDKSNHSELAEAITSMFRWYQNAAICYVYLSDVWTNNHDQVYSSSGSLQLALQESRWFTRGWTLQELIAPRSLQFFCSNCNLLGSKKSLEQQLHKITRIAVSALQGTKLSEFEVEERMSWAELRNTTREEDKVYSLLGIFDVSMPPIYGEGMAKAFDRLRDELYKREKKRSHDKLSAVLQPTIDFRKRLMARRSESPATSSSCNPSYLNPQLHPYPKGSIYSIDDATRQSLIDQLYFTEIGERVTGLIAAQGTTCRWFLTKSEYTSWYDMAQQPEHSGFLWIKGHPGTGKSTLMKLLFETANLNAKGDPSQLILSFFFRARGTAEEKSTTGLYRSLLHQIFQKVEDLRDSLDWMTPDGARGIQRNRWQDASLKQTLAYAVQKLGNRSLMIFVDALDECNQDQATGMVCFFEDLCDLARAAQVTLRICFSSRHYPTIAIQKGVEVTLEDEAGHTKDLEQYVKSKLRLGTSKQAELLRADILEKSSGIFLWVVLVIDIINGEHKSGSISLKQSRQRLKEIPPKLSELFEMIITRDGENPERLQLCLKWVLFAARPLKPLELYFAIQLGLDKSSSSCWDQEDVGLDQVKTYVRSASKGLAEVTRNKASEVQFIHESVRDYIFGKYKDQWCGESGNFVGYNHTILRDCCLAQLDALSNQGVDIPDTLPHASKSAQLRETISLKFPFLEYSVLNILYHADNAQQNAIEQGSFLVNFPLQQWKFLNNALERYEVRRYNDPVSMLYILAEKNLADLIRIYPQKESCFKVENGRYGPPFFAALATSSNEAVCMLLDIEAHMQPSTSPLHNLYKQFYQDRKKWMNLGRDFVFSPKRSVFSYVAEYRDDILLSFLIESEQNMLDVKDIKGRTPLCWAIINGRLKIVKLLLEKGANIKEAAFNGLTPIHQASIHGHIEVVKLLLEKGANIKEAAFDGSTPIHQALIHGHIEVVKLLLEKGADVKAAAFDGSTPLHQALIHGHVEVVKLLLEKGADIEAAASNGSTPLHQALINGHVNIIELLLEKGADIEAATSNGSTPLHQASIHGHVEVVKLLLEKGADIEAAASNGSTPLHQASIYGHVEVIKLLLEKGADIEAAASNGLTPLCRASMNGRVEAVKLLLEKGADMKEAASDGSTPRYWASMYGHVEVVKLLSGLG